MVEILTWFFLGMFGFSLFLGFLIPKTIFEMGGMLSVFVYFSLPSFALFVTCLWFWAQQAQEYLENLSDDYLAYNSKMAIKAILIGAGWILLLCIICVPYFLFEVYIRNLLPKF